MKRVLKWDVPVNDHAHPIGGGRVVHVGIQQDIRTVQVWTEEHTHDARPVAPLACVQVWTEGHMHDARPVAPLAWARVVGTGRPYPAEGDVAGTVIASYSPPIVWHVVVFGGYGQ